MRGHRDLFLAPDRPAPKLHTLPEVSTPIVDIHWLDGLVFALYLSGLFAVGPLTRRLVSDVEDFYVAGRNLGIMVSVGTLSAIFVGGTAVGIAGEGYLHGLSGVWFYWAYAAGFAVLALTFLYQLRDLSQITLGDIFRQRFGPASQRAASMVVFWAWLLFLAAMTVAGGRVIEVVLGVPFVWAVIMMVSVFLTYTVMGGMLAVVLVDCVQSFLLLTGLLGLFVVCLHRVGGWHSLWEPLPEHYTMLFPPGQGGYIFALLLIIAPTTVVGPDIYMKIWSMKDRATVRRSTWILIGLIVLYAVVLTAIGASAHRMLGAVSPETALPLMVKELYVPGVSGLVLVALMAASASGAVPQVIVCSSILTRDVIQGWVGWEGSSRQLVWVSRLATVLVGVLGTFLALWIRGVVELTLYSYRLFVPGIVPQILAAFYWSRAQPRAVVSSMILGPLTTLMFILVFPGTLLTYYDPLVPGLLCSVVVLYGGSLFMGGTVRAPGPPLINTASEGNET